MKAIFFLLAWLALLSADAAFAGAVATSVTGTVQVQTGASAPRALRAGDEVNQGDTVSTGPASSVVLKFDDGQVAALTANSRLQVTAYEYNPRTSSGNVLLSLIDGGMRAITGLIGRRSPSNVAYRASTATIGIRGTDVTIATSRGDVVVTVTEGAVSFTFQGQTIVIPAGQGVNARLDQPFQARAAAEILAQIPPGLATLIGGLQGLTDAIRQAAPGIPRSGETGDTGAGSATSGGITPSGPAGGTGGGAGGGTASPS